MVRGRLVLQGLCELLIMKPYRILNRGLGSLTTPFLQTRVSRYSKVGLGCPAPGNNSSSGHSLGRVLVKAWDRRLGFRVEDVSVVKWPAVRKQQHAYLMQDALRY